MGMPSYAHMPYGPYDRMHISHKSMVGGRGGSPYIRRPLSGDEACQTRTRELTNSKASARSARSAVPRMQTTIFLIFILSLFYFRSTFSFLKNRLNFGSPQIAPKSQSWTGFGSDVGRFGYPFRQPFSQYFMTPGKLLFCNKSSAKRSLLPFKPSYFATKINLSSTTCRNRAQKRQAPK